VTVSRRNVLGSSAALSLVTVEAANAQQNGHVPQPERPGRGGADIGPRDVIGDQENPDVLVPPATDSGTLPNLRFSFADAHSRLARAGWARQITERELAVATPIAGVNMRLNAGGMRKLHWHKAAEWAYMLKGKAPITAIDPQGRNFIGDVDEGDLWYFAAGIPHSTQGLNPDGCEFLPAFDDGSFSDNNTFLISDWFKHTPPEVLAKNFGSSKYLRATVTPTFRWINGWRSSHRSSCKGIST
jgi:oxalate decarboxylase